MIKFHVSLTMSMWEGIEGNGKSIRMGPLGYPESAKSFPLFNCPWRWEASRNHIHWKSRVDINTNIE